MSSLPSNSKSKRTLSLSFIFRLGVVLGVLLAGLGLGYQYASRAAFSPQKFIKQTNNQSRLNAVDFERVRIGMTLVEVQALLGAGIEIESSATGRTLLWRYEDGSSITGIFENGILKYKRQPVVS